jgi:hypothetical protein
VADKLTQQITDALTRGAAEPGGLPLYASKADAGLFPNTAGAKPAAQKCLADELLRPAPPDPKAKPPRERYALTEKGWEFLLAAVNPKQVLEDFVRVLEARQGEVGELLDSARNMAASLQGLRDAVAKVLPTVTAGKIAKPTPREDLTVLDSLAARLGLNAPGVPAGAARGLDSPAVPVAADSAPHAEAVTDTCEAIAVADLAPAICAYLADRSGPTDCPLPELFRALALTGAPTIGQFHDGLRQLHADGAVSFTAWAGPLYALPEPQYALMIGHGIAYYASLKGGPRVAGPGR